MKIKFLLAILLCLGAYTTSYASFPVERSVVENSTDSNSISNADSTVTYVSPAASTADKNLVVGIVLWFFLGWAAGHRWYYGKPVLWNILFIVTLGGLGIWWVIDLVNMITGNF
jgi:hypothetical protein